MQTQPLPTMTDRTYTAILKADRYIEVPPQLRGRTIFVALVQTAETQPVPVVSKPTKSLAGIFAKYADPAIRATEDTAWRDAAVENWERFEEDLRREREEAAAS